MFITTHLEQHSAPVWDFSSLHWLVFYQKPPWWWRDLQAAQSHKNLLPVTRCCFKAAARAFLSSVQLIMTEHRHSFHVLLFFSCFILGSGLDQIRLQAQRCERSTTSQWKNGSLWFNSSTYSSIHGAWHSERSWNTSSETRTWHGTSMACHWWTVRLTVCEWKQSMWKNLTSESITKHKVNLIYDVTTL